VRALAAPVLCGALPGGGVCGSPSPAGFQPDFSRAGAGQGPGCGALASLELTTDPRGCRVLVPTPSNTDVLGPRWAQERKATARRQATHISAGAFCLDEALLAGGPIRALLAGVLLH